MKLSIRIMGYSLGIVFLAWSISQVNWNAFLVVVASIQPLWIILSAAFLFMSMFLRSIRWRILTGLPAKDQSKVWEATSIGYLGTVLYPARAGDVMRIFRLQQLTDMGGGQVASSSVIDRIIEGLGLFGLLLVILHFWKADLLARESLLGVALLFLVAAVVAVLFTLSGHKLRSLFNYLAATRGKWGNRLNLWYEQSLSGLQVLRSPRRILLALFMQGLVSLFDILSCWVLMQSFGWTLPLMAGVMVLVYIAAAASFPSLPGFIGVYQISAVFALRPFGVDDSACVAYGTVLQVLTLALFISPGMWLSLNRRKNKPLAG